MQNVSYPTSYTYLSGPTSNQAPTTGQKWRPSSLPQQPPPQHQPYLPQPAYPSGVEKAASEGMTHAGSYNQSLRQPVPSLSTTFSSTPPESSNTTNNHAYASTATHTAPSSLPEWTPPRQDVLQAPYSSSVQQAEGDPRDKVEANGVEGQGVSPKVDTLTKNTNSRIDPAFLPRPLISTDPISQPGGKRYETDKYTIPPPPYGIYTVYDRGSASCRFIRMSLNQVPYVANTLTSSAVPFDFEEPVPLVNLNKGSLMVASTSETEGPLRCFRCHAYVSPHVTFPNESTATCNFCGHTFDIPKHYQIALSEFTRFRQQDYSDTISPDVAAQYDLAELSHGTVDYVAPPAFLTLASGMALRYTQKSDTAEPVVVPPAICFVIDASEAAQRNGLMAASIAAVKYSLGLITCDQTDVAVISYDDRVKFFPFSSSVNRQVLIMTDIEDPFAPAGPTILFAKAIAQRQQIESLLDQLPRIIEEVPSTGGVQTAKLSCGNAALKAAVALLMTRGGAGVVKAFYSTYPERGVGSWSKAALTAKSSDALTASSFIPPADLASFYNALIRDCINHGISVDTFVGSLPKRHANIGTLSYVTRKTGGRCFYYSGFYYNRDFQRLCADVANQMLLPAGFDCVFKLRCSRGISVTKMYSAGTLGKSEPSVDVFGDPSSFRLPRIDADTAFLFQLQHDGEIPEGERCAYLQYACLHTTREGYRRIRVVTIVVEVTNSLSTTFRYSEVEPVLAYFIRKHGDQVAQARKTDWKTELNQRLVDILFSYRLNCAANASPGQLILPDALKSLPVYISAMLKHPAFRSTGDMSLDEQDALLVRLMDLPLHQLIAWMYPRLYVLHRSYVQVKGEKLNRVGEPTGCNNEVYLPPILPCNGEKVTTDGIFLLDDGLTFMLYVGQDVNPKTMIETFGVDSLTSENVQQINPEELYGKLGETIKNTVAQLRKDKGLLFPWQPLRLIRPRSLEESQFIWHLVEDRLGPEESYVGFLCNLHKAVHKKMEDT